MPWKALLRSRRRHQCFNPNNMSRAVGLASSIRRINSLLCKANVLLMLMSTGIPARGSTNLMIGTFAWPMTVTSRMPSWSNAPRIRLNTCSVALRPLKFGRCRHRSRSAPSKASPVTVEPKGWRDPSGEIRRMIL